jgi:multidrug efflux pump subunit AcrA (membrane-fusion protein)
VEIDLAIDEGSGKLIHVGQEVLINGNISGIIEEISPSASLETGKVAFSVVAGEAENLVPGAVAEVSIELTYKLPNLIIVPLSYVTVAQNENYVLVVEDGKVAKRTVKLDKIYDSHVEVTDGLVEGDQMIVTNGEFLDIGQEVEMLATE